MNHPVGVLSHQRDGILMLYSKSIEFTLGFIASNRKEGKWDVKM
jgi:hypothetical protein